jgi:hypothetical protein
MLEDEHRLNLGKLLHAKHTYNFFSLLDYISLYFIAIEGTGHVLHCFQGFSKDPFILVLTLQNGIPYFCVFFI